MPKTKKTPEQIALEKAEKEALKLEEKLRKEGYEPSHPVSNTYGSENTAKYVAKYYKDAVIVYHPNDKWWEKCWKVWIRR